MSLILQNRFLRLFAFKPRFGPRQCRRRLCKAPVRSFTQCAGMESPTHFMASMASSAGIKLPMPASAISAAKSACTAAPPLRFMQGTSTSPATGSHTSPSMFLKQCSQQYLPAQECRPKRQQPRLPPWPPHCRILPGSRQPHPQARHGLQLQARFALPQQARVPAVLPLNCSAF